MTEKELMAVLKARLQAITWNGSTKVFHTNSIIITAGADDEALSKVIMPCVLIRPGTQIPDREQPNLFTQELEFTIIVSVAGDALGQNAIMGANRTANTSPGAGILDIHEAILDNFSMLSAQEGVIIAQTFAGAVFPTVINKTTWLSARKLKFSAWINSNSTRTI